MKRFLAILMCVMFSGAIACAQPARRLMALVVEGRADPQDRGRLPVAVVAVAPAWAGRGTNGRSRSRRNRRMGPGGMGGPGGGPMRQFEMLRGYLDVVDRYSKISSDPTTAGIAAVVAAAEVLKPRGPEAIADYFTKLLPDVKNEAVARAIRSQLAEQYKNSGQQDKSLEQLRVLITGNAPPSDKK